MRWLIKIKAYNDLVKCGFLLLNNQARHAWQTNEKCCFNIPILYSQTLLGSRTLRRFQQRECRSFYKKYILLIVIKYNTFSVLQLIKGSIDEAVLSEHGLLFRCDI
jgi:hypothetical protein